MRAFDEFRLQLGGVGDPPSCDDMRLFASWLMLTRCGKASSLRQYLSAVKTHYNALGMWVPAPSEFGPLAAVVEGSKRLFPGPIRRSRPVSVEILRNLVRTRPPAAAGWAERTTLQVLKDGALLLFFSLLRSSSLFPPTVAEADADRNLVWERVRFIDGGVVISTVLSKTIQHRQTVHQVSLKERPGSQFCPVAALRRLRALKGGAPAPRDHVFQVPTGAGGWRLLLKRDMERWFSGRVAAMGLDPDRYLLHGFRHGGIALALSVEPNLALVKLQSAHLSDAIWVYSQVDPRRRLAVADAMVAAVEHDRA